ncbi:MAG: SGNH/GDSL hydrolase family protein [Acidobacteriia bacterium]|nr:SGNH/GDSL hydrolase family protein [Terriglobia bacterium]
MRLNSFKRTMFTTAVAALALAATPAAWAQPWVSFDDNTRYLALGDSLSAGYEAKPVTQGFVFQLYQGGVIDIIDNLLFCTEAVPGATSADVLQYQVPQAHLFFQDTGKPYRRVVTLTVGGNDLLSLLNSDGTVNREGAPGALAAYGSNLAGILGSLAGSFPDAKIYVGNLYDPKLPVAGEDQLIGALNQVTGAVAALFPGVAVVDLFAAFQGKSGLLISEKQGAGFNIHPTNAGYQVMTRAFADVIGRQ